MAPRRSPLAIVMILLAAAGGEAAAHESASQTGAYYRARYLLCGRAPVEHLHCVGPIRARPRLLAALQPPAGGDLGGQIDRARDAAVDAVYFNVREAVPALRALMRQRPEAGEIGTWAEMGKQGLRAEAAYALAHLGDDASADEIRDLVGEFELRGHGSLWLDTLAALAVLEPARASRYAIDFIGRAGDLRTSMPGGSSKLAALDFIRVEERVAALPVLERRAKAEERGYAHAHCELMAARVRLDERLRDAVRKQFLGSYGGSWLAGCDGAVLARLGADPDDAAALVRHLGRDDRGMDFGIANVAYVRILELIAAMDARLPGAGGPERERIRRAREVLRRGLEERSRWPHVADPKHANYALHYVALHTAALAGLGDGRARGKLLALIDDSADRTGTAWIAAYWALRLRLPDAAARAGALAVRGVAYANTERRGFLYQDVRARLLDAFADLHPDDPRWTVLLLDPDSGSRASEQALYRLSRHAPKGACDAVAAAARQARTEAAEHALLALTGLGAACVPAIERLFGDGTASAEVRGAALEMLAVLEAPSLCASLERARREQVWRPAIERAALLAPAACARPPAPRRNEKPRRGEKSPRRGEEPLPPRGLRQGL